MLESSHLFGCKVDMGRRLCDKPCLLSLLEPVVLDKYSYRESIGMKRTRSHKLANVLKLEIKVGVTIASRRSSAKALISTVAAFEDFSVL